MGAAEEVNMDCVAWGKLALNVFIAGAVGYQTGDVGGAITAVAAVLAGLFQKQPHK